MKIPVLIPNIFDHPFTYESEINVNQGDYIVVPFGKSKKVGVVWDSFQEQNTKKYKLKKIIKKLAIEPLNFSTIKFSSFSEKDIFSFLSVLIPSFKVLLIKFFLNPFALLNVALIFW